MIEQGNQGYYGKIDRAAAEKLLCEFPSKHNIYYLVRQNSADQLVISFKKNGVFNHMAWPNPEDTIEDKSLQNLMKLLQADVTLNINPLRSHAKKHALCALDETCLKIPSLALDLRPENVIPNLQSLGRYSEEAIAKWFLLASFIHDINLVVEFMKAVKRNYEFNDQFFADIFKQNPALEAHTKALFVKNNTNASFIKIYSSNQEVFIPPEESKKPAKAVYEAFEENPEISLMRKTFK